MTEILLIRHGETDWNVEKRLQGHIDIALNAQGEQQAAALGYALQDEALDAVIASDLQRALQTAQAVAQRQSLPVHTSQLLRERCYGAFEGLRYGEISTHYPEAYARWQARDIDAVFPSGLREAESFRQFYQRIVSFVMQCALQHDGKKIALVAHGGVLECVYRAAQRLPLETPRNFPVLNASINRITVEQGVLRLVAWGDVAHLDAAALDEVDQRVP